MENQPVATEAQAQPAVERKTPASMSEAITGIREVIARSSAAPKEQTVEAKGEKEVPCTECEEEKRAREAAAASQPKRRYYIVDEETGNKIPAVYTSEGKEFVPETIEQLQTWTGLGIHAGERLKSVKEKEAFLKQNEAVVKELVQAMKDGRIVVNGQGLPALGDNGQPAAGMTPDDEEGADDIITDPVIIRQGNKIKALEKEIADLKALSGTLTKAFVDEKVGVVEKSIRGEMDSLKGEYPLAYRRQQDVWKLLSETREEDGAPRYDVKTAMQKVHEDHLQGLREYVSQHPEFIEKDKIVAEGVKQYLAQKARTDEAPVSSPSGTPTVATPAEPPKAKTLHEAAVNIASFLQSKKAQGNRV